MALKFDDSSFRMRMELAKSIVKKASKDAEDRCAEELLRLSQLEVPLDVSTLQKSGHTGRDAISAYVAYGGNAKQYAIVQHERTDFAHANGRKAKYLEDPLKKNKSRFTNYIMKNTIESALK